MKKKPTIGERLAMKFYSASIGEVCMSDTLPNQMARLIDREVRKAVRETWGASGSACLASEHGYSEDEAAIRARISAKYGVKL